MLPKSELNKGMEDVNLTLSFCFMNYDDFIWKIIVINDSGGDEYSYMNSWLIY